MVTASVAAVVGACVSLVSPEGGRARIIRIRRITHMIGIKMRRISSAGDFFLRLRAAEALVRGREEDREGD